MAPRLALHDRLTEITERAYFQPPENIQMQYPCIVYARDSSQASFADNDKYLRVKRYQVTVIDRDPDSDLPDQVEDLPLCSIQQFFATDNLNHWVFDLYF